MTRQARENPNVNKQSRPWHVFAIQQSQIRSTLYFKAYCLEFLRTNFKKKKNLRKRRRLKADAF